MDDRPSAVAALFTTAASASAYSARWPLASISQRTPEAERRTRLDCSLPSFASGER